MVDGTGGNQVLVLFTSRYQDAKPEVLEVLPRSARAANFETKLNASFNCRGLPIEVQQKIADELNGMAKRLGLPDGTVALTTSYIPNENFHVARHTSLPLETNLRLAAAYPCTMQVKVRNATTVNAEEISVQVASLKKLEVLAESAKPALAARFQAALGRLAQRVTGAAPVASK